MTDEPTNPEVEVETEEQAVPAENGQEIETETEGGEGEQPEEVEIDFAGRKERFRLDGQVRDVADKVQNFVKSLQGDYTRKTQEIAEAAKSLKMREEGVQKLSSLNGEALAEYSRGLSIRAEIEELEKVDLAALWQSSPDQARRVSDAISQRRAAFQQSISRLNAVESQVQQTEHAEITRKRTEARAAIEKVSPGFEKDVPEIAEYVEKAYGIPKDHCIKVWDLDPATALMARKAMLYDRMQKASSKATQAAPAKEAKPVPATAAKGGAQGPSNPQNMTPAQMAQYLGLPKGR